MDLWLIRHGESTWNALGLAQGHCDQARLTRHGEQQAWAVAAQLRRRPIGLLYASDLRRARQTAAPLATVLGLPVTGDARLRERCLGILEGTDATAIHPTVSGLRAQRVVDADVRPAGGETLREFYRRVAEFADDLAPPPRGDIAIDVMDHSQVEACRFYPVSVVFGERICRRGPLKAPTGYIELDQMWR